MFGIKKFNPVAKAVGIMGAVAALAGGITFASLQSNTVALSPNNLVTASATLAIGAGTTCPGGDTTTTTGFTTTSPLVPGGSPVTTGFCLTNKGDVPLTVSANIPTNPSGTAATDTTLGISCTTEGDLTNNTQTLNAFSTTAFTNPLPAGASDNCTASAALSNSYSGTGGETVPVFDIDFTGNQ